MSIINNITNSVLYLTFVPSVIQPHKYNTASTKVFCDINSQSSYINNVEKCYVTNESAKEQGKEENNERAKQ